jgi:hypothetical protein
MATTNHLSSFLDENYRRFHLPWRCSIIIAIIVAVVLTDAFEKSNGSYYDKQASRPTLAPVLQLSPSVTHIVIIAAITHHSTHLHRSSKLVGAI